MTIELNADASEHKPGDIGPMSGLAANPFVRALTNSARVLTIGAGAAGLALTEIACGGDAPDVSEQDGALPDTTSAEEVFGAGQENYFAPHIFVPSRNIATVSNPARIDQDIVNGLTNLAADYALDGNCSRALYNFSLALAEAGARDNISESMIYSSLDDTISVALAECCVGEARNSARAGQENKSSELLEMARQLGGDTSGEGSVRADLLRTHFLKKALAEAAKGNVQGMDSNFTKAELYGATSSDEVGLENTAGTKILQLATKEAREGDVRSTMAYIAQLKGFADNRLEPSTGEDLIVIAGPSVEAMYDVGIIYARCDNIEDILAGKLAQLGSARGREGREAAANNYARLAEEHGATPEQLAGIKTALMNYFSESAKRDIRFAYNANDIAKALAKMDKAITYGAPRIDAIYVQDTGVFHIIERVEREVDRNDPFRHDRARLLGLREQEYVRPWSRYSFDRALERVQPLPNTQ